MPSLLDSATHGEFLKNLITWYGKHGRHNMPWRKTKDPYAIFVSEFMLQQTTVATVRPYFDRFLKKFPSVKSLARGELNSVLALWSGLGYYARARNLWSAMRIVHQKYKGNIPADIETLQKFPGVGYYTAGAISSLAFNKPSAVLDANIIRVFLRLLAIEDDPKLKAVQVLLRKVGLDLAEGTLKARKDLKNVKKKGPRGLVLALMDLGATVCLPKNPKCLICPVSKHCLAKSYGKQNDIPLRPEKVERPVVRRFYAVVESKGRFLMGRRPKNGLFGGLWEFFGHGFTKCC